MQEQNNPAPRYFDAFSILGRTLHHNGTQPETAEELLAEMDHFGIHEALVIDSLSASTNPIEGNRRIVERTRSHPRLHPVWAGLCTHSKELPPPEELAAQMRSEGVGALVLFYGQFDIRLSQWAVYDLLGEMARVKAPVILCPTPLRGGYSCDDTDWEAVVRVCRDLPDLPVIVVEERIYGSQRALYEALHACPNLRVDLSAIWLHRRIEYICREFGAERLVWSSRLPRRTPAAPLVQLNYSDISPGELALIAGENMRRLLSWNENVTCVDPKTVTFSPPTDELHEKARGCRSLRDENFHDCHGHLGWCSNRHVIHDTPADVVAEMDKFGVRTACAFSFAGSMADEIYGNDAAAEVIEAFPGRFIGFTLVNPHRGEAGMVQELQRGYERGMRGIKLATAFQDYPDEGPLVDVACRFADEHGLFLLNHTWGGPAQMRRLCETYTNACFFTGHANAAFAEITRDCDNLYICTCPFLSWRQTEDFVRLYGADRLLFGSDLMDLPIGWGLGPILFARISLEEKRKILGENLLHLMRRYNITPHGTQKMPSDAKT